MIHISNLRKESADGWTKLIVDITYGGGGYNCLVEPNIWIAVKDEYAYMLSDDVYDAFVLVPLYIGMSYNEDIHIHGCVSKKLYKNVMTYLQKILCDFSDKLSRIDIHVDGFKTADGEPEIIGTGISCGIDSFTTIYDHYANEDDPDYRINTLFFHNCGSHGGYGEKSKQLFFDRYALNKPAADELGLPIYLIDSNLHAFERNVGHYQNIGYFARFSCIIGLQRAIKKYYMASAYSYEEIKRFSSDIDFAEFSESYSVPLMCTEKLEFVIDGCQYTRSQKTEHIADWEIAQKYMNVCTDASAEGHNCSKCGKCMRTLLALEALGKLNNFAGVFDIETYKKHSFANKCDIVLHKGRDAFSYDNYKFALTHGMRMPLYLTAWVYLLPRQLYLLPRRLFSLTKKAVRKIIGQKLYNALKKKIKG